MGYLRMYGKQLTCTFKKCLNGFTFLCKIRETMYPKFYCNSFFCPDHFMLLFFKYLNISAPISPTLHPLPLATTNLFPISINLFFLLLFFDSTYKWDHVVFVFVWLIWLSVIPSRCIHVVENGKISFFFCLMAELIFHCLYIHHFYDSAV